MTYWLGKENPIPSHPKGCRQEKKKPREKFPEHFH
jgi:hypothetical protein